MKDRVLLIGGGNEGLSALAIAHMKQQYGEDIIIVTPEEAKEQGLNMSDFVNTPSMKITAPPIMEQPMILGTPPSGKERRRKRREEERKANKKSK
jgi:hypothetical protein